jgi:phosphoenolpyruvate---glycerone phosphotransferase subunit DhaL
MTVSKKQIVQWLETSAQVMEANQAHLTQLDSEIGDADHGSNMNRGFEAVVDQLPGCTDKDIGTILKNTGMALISSVGGASGPLYGTFFLRIGAVAAAKEELNSQDLHDMLQSGIAGIVQRGRAQIGDKTMVDAWNPALDALKGAIDEHRDTVSALKLAVEAARRGMRDTIPLQARKGRASYLGARSIGHQDPGATSSYLLLKTLLDTVEQG